MSNRTRSTTELARTLSVASFIHSSKFSLMTSSGTLILAAGAGMLVSGRDVFDWRDDSACCCPSARSSGNTVIFVLFRRLRLSAASSCMLDSFSAARLSFRLESPSDGLYSDIRRFPRDLRALGVAWCSSPESESSSYSGWEGSSSGGGRRAAVVRAIVVPNKRRLRT